MNIEREMAIAEQKAWEALGRYKFLMFGYQVAWWVKLNRMSGLRRPNPWAELVKLARDHFKPQRQRQARLPMGDRA